MALMYGKGYGFLPAKEYSVTIKIDGNSADFGTKGDLRMLSRSLSELVEGAYFHVEVPQKISYTANVSGNKVTGRASFSKEDVKIEATSVSARKSLDLATRVSQALINLAEVKNDVRGAA